MIDYTQFIQPDNGQSATEIHLVDSAGFDDWLADQPSDLRDLVTAQKFDGSAGQHAVLCKTKDAGLAIVAGVEDAQKLGPWCLAALAGNLGAGQYRLHDASAGEAILGWMLAHYRYDAHLSAPKKEAPRILLVGEPARIDAVAIEAAGMALVRDLVNCPPELMGPADMEAQAKRLSEAHSATLTVTKGDVLEQEYPLIHAVGKAAARKYAPRLIELEWGDERHPRVAIVGKGVSFDSGGLNIKASSGMRNMKKDMGGAAHALALAEMIMKLQLPVRLHMLVPAVENAISGIAFRPGDILRSRKGLSVEIDNTDAEGRLILADALCKAQEDAPDCLIDFATLTGAARTALGPDLPPVFGNDDALADGIVAAGTAKTDPVWRMPLWAPYNEMLSSDVADVVNSGGRFAGAITAALFLQKFIESETCWAHIDTFAWMPSAKPGRPKGGEALGLRAVLGYLAQTYPVR